MSKQRWPVKGRRDDPLSLDPGNIFDTIDADARERVIVCRSGFDGTPHITPDELEAIEADLLLAARREVGQ